MPAAPSRRAVLLGLALPFTAGVSGCTLRLEDSTKRAVGGQGAGPTDVQPLQQVRATLVEVIAGTKGKPVQQVHQAQLRELDALLRALHATPSASPTTSSTATSSSTNSPSVSAPSPSTPSEEPDPYAPSGVSSGAKHTEPWHRSEYLWLAEATRQQMAKVSEYNRPLVLAMPAAGLAAVIDNDGAVPWPTGMTFPADGAADVGTALDSAITALEWVAARAQGKTRDNIGQRLIPLTTAQTLTQAANPKSGPAPRQHFNSDAEARRAATASLKAVQSASAKAAAHAASANEVGGVILAWAAARAALTDLGQQQRPFDGLATPSASSPASPSTR